MLIDRYPEKSYQGISLALYRVICRELGSRVSTLAIEAGRQKRGMTAEDVALKGYKWVERGRPDGGKTAALPARERKGHFFFRFDSERYL